MFRYWGMAFAKTFARYCRGIGTALGCRHLWSKQYSKMEMIKSFHEDKIS